MATRREEKEWSNVCRAGVAMKETTHASREEKNYGN
jgi:hypothetical protein